jgi:hypothetical protein
MRVYVADKEDRSYGAVIWETYPFPSALLSMPHKVPRLGI